jgi:two-component system response regulator AtoC
LHAPTRSRVLLIDDDPGQIELLTAQLERSDRFVTMGITDPRQALELVRSDPPDAVICDLVMPEMSGFEVVRAIRDEFPTLPILVLTGKTDADDADRAFEAGASDFATKPVQPGSLIARLSRAIDEVPALQLLQEATGRRYDPQGILGNHPRVDEVRRFVVQLGAVPGVPALVLGESGTGKNLVARAIHAASRGAEYRFVEVNCAALPDNLLEAEIFGYEKGAFTDAKTAKRGLAEVANDGTLFLDEVGTLPLALQAKLLTFLESRRFRRVGGTEDIEVQVRIVAATNADIQGLVRSGVFREDLYYRLNVAQIVLPALREMRSDIGLLARHFIQRSAEYFGKPVPQLDPKGVERLEAYDWPGNVRELRNVVERALIFSKGDTLRVDPFIPVLSAPQLDPEQSGADGGLVIPPGLTLDEVERRYIEATLEDVGGEVQEAARRLGVTRKVLWARRRKHGLL